MESNNFDHGMKMTMESDVEPADTTTPLYDLSKLKERIEDWVKKVKDGADLVATPSSQTQPFKNVYAAIESVSVVNFQLDTIGNVPSVAENFTLKFWLRFTKIHVLSALAKWNEISEELSVAELQHLQCIDLIEKELSNIQTPEALLSKMQIEVKEGAQSDEEMMKGVERFKFMYIYELTRYAILCSERDNQEKALELLKKAEGFYHDHAENVIETSSDPSKFPILGILDTLNAETSKDMFTYVLFYLGQAYKIQGEKERAIFYLHMVLRRQLEKGDYNNITWASDSSKMALVLMGNSQSFETARDILIAATTVMKSVPEGEKSLDNFKQNYADLGRIWGKFGVTLLEFSGDRLKDLEEYNRKQVKFQSRIRLNQHEKLSLGIKDENTDLDTILLLRALKFPTLDVRETDEIEMKGKFVRDFDEARACFLSAQRWINISKAYYNIEEFAGDYIELVTDHALLFKQLLFFEPSLERQIKMHKRRITILEELLSLLNSKVYTDIFHEQLRELAETYEAIYKLKVDELKDRGKCLKPKDQKLVKLLADSVEAHKRNLKLFGFHIDHPEKVFPEEYERILMACVLSSARMLGSITHDHPLHPDAIQFGEESKSFYNFFLGYLDRRTELKREFFVLYEGSQDMPDLLDSQIRKIRHHYRMRSTMEPEGTD